MLIRRVHPAFHRIEAGFEGRGVSYLYLLKGDAVAIFDTGVPTSPKNSIQPALAQIGMTLSDVDFILNTHVHMDHTGGNAAMKEASGAAIHVHAADLPAARSREIQLEALNRPYRELGAPDQMVQQRASYIQRNCGDPFEADVVLSDGDTVDLGGGIRLRVIHVPGHTPGSACYYWESEGILFAGDAVQGEGARIGGYPAYADAAAYRRSLSRLSEMDVRTLCVCHPFTGGSYTNEPERTGEDVTSLLSVSAQAADATHKAVSSAMSRMPDASNREIALAAISDLVFHIPQLLDPSTRLPRSAPIALLAHIKAVQNGDYPE